MAGLDFSKITPKKQSELAIARVNLTMQVGLRRAKLVREAKGLFLALGMLVLAFVVQLIVKGTSGIRPFLFAFIGPGGGSLIYLSIRLFQARSELRRSQKELKGFDSIFFDVYDTNLLGC